MASEAILASLLGRYPYEHGCKSASKIGSKTSFIAVCTTRSSTVAMPSGLVPPLGLGISTTRTGANWYCCSRRASCSLCIISSSYPVLIIHSIAMPSTPGAPLLALTCRQASQRTSALQTLSYRLYNLFFLSCLDVRYRALCSFRTLSTPLVAVRQSDIPHSFEPHCLQQGPCPLARFPGR